LIVNARGDLGNHILRLRSPTAQARRTSLLREEIACRGPAGADRRPAGAGPESPRSRCGNLIGRALLVSSGPVLPAVAPIMLAAPSC
jgi:hypothetical protein